MSLNVSWKLRCQVCSEGQLADCSTKVARHRKMPARPVLWKNSKSNISANCQNWFISKVGSFVGSWNYLVQKTNEQSKCHRGLILRRYWWWWWWWWWRRRSYHSSDTEHKTTFDMTNHIPGCFGCKYKLDPRPLVHRGRLPTTALWS